MASEEEGAASIVEIYAALLLGFIIEGNAALREVCITSIDAGRAHPDMQVMHLLSTSRGTCIDAGQGKLEGCVSEYSKL